MPVLLPGCSREGRNRRNVLSCGLADRGADHDLEDLVLAEAGFLRRSDVLVGDLIGVLGDLVDQRPQRIRDPFVVERGAALLARCAAVSFEDPRDESAAPLLDVRHAVRLSSFLRDTAPAIPSLLSDRRIGPKTRETMPRRTRGPAEVSSGSRAGGRRPGTEAGP